MNFFLSVSQKMRNLGFAEDLGISEMYQQLAEDKQFLVENPVSND